MKVFFRADGNTQTGMGHVVRTVAIAEMLAKHFQPVFIIRNPVKGVYSFLEKYGSILSIPEATPQTAADEILNHTSREDIIVLDGYHYTTEYQKKIKDAGNKLVCIDDIAPYKFLADVIINHGAGASIKMYDAEPYTAFYIGLEYAIMRKHFLEAAKKSKTIPAVSSAFINMGGADLHNISLKAARGLLQTSLEQIHIVAGLANPHLASLQALQNDHQDRLTLHLNLESLPLCQLMESCQLAICPASSIAMELCCTGIGLLIGYTASNQKNIYEGLIQKKMARGIGDLLALSESEITNQALFCIQNTSALQSQIVHQKQELNGDSGEKILRIFQQLAS